MSTSTNILPQNKRIRPLIRKVSFFFKHFNAVILLRFLKDQRVYLYTCTFQPALNGSFWRYTRNKCSKWQFWGYIRFFFTTSRQSPLKMYKIHLRNNLCIEHGLYVCTFTRQVRAIAHTTIVHSTVFFTDE